MTPIITEISSIVAEYFEENLYKSLKDKKDLSLLLLDMETFLHDIGAKATKELLEKADETVKNIPGRSKKWYVKDKAASGSLTTIFGEVNYKRTYYENRETGKYAFLSDELLGISAHDKTESALEARMIEEAAETAYRRSGKKASKAVTMSGQTVMNSLRKLGSIQNADAPLNISSKEKKQVKTLYIEADEDHVALQEGGIVMPYLVYVHEGKKYEGKKRLRLLNVRSFGGVYKEPEDLWLEVSKYIDRVYDIDQIEKIYISGDGAPWIKSGTDWIPKSIYVVDRYHLKKYVKQSAAHIEGGEDELWDAIDDYDKDYLDTVFETILADTESETKQQAVKKARRYINSAWESIAYHKASDYVNGSAEGHVSHMLSARLSSRPLGWCTRGADQMARLRIFKSNGGDVHQLLLKKKVSKRREELEEYIDHSIRKMRKQKSGTELAHNLAAVNIGKHTPLVIALKGLRGII